MNITRIGLVGTLLSILSLALCACPSSSVGVRPEDTADRPDRRVSREVQAANDFQSAVALWQGLPPVDYTRVEDLLESAVEKDPGLATAWFNLGVVREERGDIEGATQAYRQSNVADATYVNGLANLAAVMMDAGQEEQAEQLLLQVVGIEQFHPGANLNLANIHRRRARQGEYVNREEADQAINHVRMALAGDAMNVHAYETLAAIYFDLQQYSLARLVCLNAITLGLDSADLRNRLGLIALADDDVTTAYAQFRQATAQDEHHVDALVNLGAIALNYRDYEGAYQAFDRALTLQPDNTEIMLSRAVALRGMEDLAGAEQGYQQVLAIDPENLNAMYNLAILYQEYLQDYEAALTWYQNYLRFDPGRRSALADDVQTRIDVTNQLIEIRRLYGDQTGGATVEEEEPVGPGIEPPEEPEPVEPPGEPEAGVDAVP